jgi:hypothetical protein
MITLFQKQMNSPLFWIHIISLISFSGSQFTQVMYSNLFSLNQKSKSKSKSCYDWRSVSQYVVVSSSLWNPWPHVIFCLKVAVLSLWGALSDERSGLSPVSYFQQCLVHCQRFNIIYIVHVTCFKYMQYIIDLSQHRLSTADHANIYATTTI